MDANEYRHNQWIGMAQPEGLVVTAAALKAAEANITWPVTELQATLRDLAGEGKVILDLHAFLRELLEWSDEFIVAGEALPASLRVHLDGQEMLAPALALQSADEPGTFVMLVGEASRIGIDLDAATDDKRWTATAHQRFERLLRETGIPAGLLTNGKAFRLVYAPKGESAGWITFRLNEMLSVDGRPLLGALHMLLHERRLLSLEDTKRLPGLLKASREYQNTVSNALREQVLSALRELLIGFQNADRVADGAILRDYRHEYRQEIYTGLVTVLMRMVFVLYAEERGLLPMESDLYATSYSLSRLHAQLQTDRNRHGDTIDDRYGAWARVISLFRMLHDGVHAARSMVSEGDRVVYKDELFIPAREGRFFDPDAFPFLEGRPRQSVRQKGEVLELPRVSDGVVFRVLDQLLLLGGERLQYKGLDVEQIGSVYEGLMGFELEVAEGDSLALMPEHVVVDVEALLKLSGPERVKQIKTLANLDLKDKAAGVVKEAKTVEALHAALGRRVSSRQPGLIARGSLFLQPGEERRKTGSHYTPRSLTLPIVETTLRPVLERLGPEVTPEQILELKVCDPAMGSGAFLVEACRQLADHLVAAWRRTGTMPVLPADQDLLLHARRLIAQRCIYGVDKNPLAVDLARLSLWLVTFAREHPFTFVDHSLRHGDSLVGLSREQIASFSLDTSKGKQIETIRTVVLQAVEIAEELRNQIHAIVDPADNRELEDLWDQANEALATVRMLGDLLIAAYFSEESDKARKKTLENLAGKIPSWLATGAFDAELRGIVADLKEGEKPVPPFHWEIEFPEVFDRRNSGFDCFAGNPPFLGGGKVSSTLGEPYLAWLLSAHDQSHGNADLVAYFFRQAFNVLRNGGTFGLVATNTIAQGDTRSTGLLWLCKHGATIYAATRRFKWPGEAAVIVSIVEGCKGTLQPPFHLDGRSVDQITSFLFHQGAHEDPYRLKRNNGLSFIGVKPTGMGFTFDDGNTAKGASPLAEMNRILALDSRYSQRIRPYLGGEELNESPTHSPRRYIIDLNDLDETEANEWPGLLNIIEQKVKPERLAGRLSQQPWWRFERARPDLTGAISGFSHVFVCSQTSKYRCFASVPTSIVFDQKLVVLAVHEWQAFAVLHSRIHEDWAVFFGSSMRDDPVYTPSDCFETFPFPPTHEINPALESIGKDYYEFRAALMVRNNEGLTKTYNRFHDPDERSPDILRLRELHAAMDRAVLDAYGWTEIQPEYDFRPQLDESLRYTWSEETRDEVLARLLELNRVMAAKEAEEASAKGEGGKPAKKGAGKNRAKKDEGTLELPLGGRKASE